MAPPRRSPGRFRNSRRLPGSGTASGPLNPVESDDQGGSQILDGPAGTGTTPIAGTGSQDLDGAQPAPRGRRTGSSSRELSSASSRRTAAVPKEPRHIGLKTKFTLVMGGIIVVVLTALGLLMASKANTYLFSQKQHDGIEVAKLTASIVNSMTAEAMRVAQSNGSAIDYTRLADNIEKAIRQATDWETAGKDQTDILAVTLVTPKHKELNGVAFGTEEDGKLPIGERYQRIFVPKSGETVRLPPTVEVYEGIRKAESRQIPVYRFKIRLDPLVFGADTGLSESAKITDDIPHLRLDMDASSIDKALGNLRTAIILGVILSIAIAIAVSTYLARTITQPLTLLVKDMKIVAQGDLEHRTEARSNDEVGDIAGEFDRMTQSLKTAQAAVVEQEKAEYELSLAREVQRQLLPANPPEIPGYQCGSFYQGAKAVSGDYFDFIDLGEGKWGFIIADVSGKGVPGSMVMAVTRTVIRLISGTHRDQAGETLKETNRLIAKQIKRGMFVTSFYVVLDTATGHLTYACAGHNPMVIYRAAAGGYELAHGKGIALGFNEGPLFDRTLEVHTSILEPGDAIVLYTDGFPEAMNANSEEFGDERFYQAIARNGDGDVGTLISGLVSEITDHRGEADQSDDLTLLAVRRG